MDSLARSAVKIALQHLQEVLQLLPQLGLQLLLPLPLFAAVLGAASPRGMDFLGKSARRLAVWNRSLVRILVRIRGWGFALRLAVASPRGTDCKERSAAAPVAQDRRPLALEPNHPRIQPAHSLLALCSLLVCNLSQLSRPQAHLPHLLAVLCYHPRTWLPQILVLCNPSELNHPLKPPHILVALCPRPQPYNLVFYRQQLMRASLGPDPSEAYELQSSRSIKNRSWQMGDHILPLCTLR